MDNSDDGLSYSQSQLHCVTRTAAHVTTRLQPVVIVEPAPLIRKISGKELFVWMFSDDNKGGDH